MSGVVCIGAALVDDAFTSIAEPQPGTSNPSVHRRSAGGVARNVAHHLALLGHAVELVAHLGEDTDGIWLGGVCRSAGIGLLHAHTGSEPTGRYASILSPCGELFAGAADTGCEKHLTVSFLESRARLLASARLVLADCNLGPEALAWLVAFCRERGIPCVIEPVSAPKAERLAQADLRGVLLITPNVRELGLSGAARGFLERGVRFVWARRGGEGSDLHSQEGVVHLDAPAVPIVDTTGAGDAALAGWIHAFLDGKDPVVSLRYGHALAGLILQVHGAYTSRLERATLASLAEG